MILRLLKPHIFAFFAKTKLCDFVKFLHNHTELAIKSTHFWRTDLFYYVDFLTRKDGLSFEPAPEWVLKYVPDFVTTPWNLNHPPPRHVLLNSPLSLGLIRDHFIVGHAWSRTFRYITVPQKRRIYASGVLIVSPSGRWTNQLTHWSLGDAVV